MRGTDLRLLGALVLVLFALGLSSAYAAGKTSTNQLGQVVTSDPTPGIDGARRLRAPLPVTVGDGGRLARSEFQVSGCPTGQTCYYFSASTGNDLTGAGTQSSPWRSISKAMSVLSTLKPGDRELFKGGDIWVASSSNPPFTFGDSPLHAVNGSADNPIIISTYGAGRATIDAANMNPYCFVAHQPAYSVKYLTIDNFECEHAYAQAVSFTTAGGKMPGITVQNFYIHNNGTNCSNTTGPCRPTAEVPADWSSNHSYAANSNTVYGIIYPTIGNPGGYWYMETVPSCTSGSRQPIWPQVVGASVKDNNCNWQNTGVWGAYKNQLELLDTAVGSDGVQFLYNTVIWSGGHNAVQVHYDTGGVLVEGNVVGPGCVHGCIDVKGVGSPATPAQIVGNVAGCGYSQNLCGCQNSGGVNNCATNQTPAFYTHNESTKDSETLIYQRNVAYDDGIGFQDCPSVTPCPGNCPTNVKYYNNTAYLPRGLSNSFGLYAGCGGNNSSSTIDVRNNIFDGAGTASVSVASGFGLAIEDYNDIGGAQGSPGFSFNGSNQKGPHDFTNVNPMYINSSSAAPDFGLQVSPCFNAGLPGLTTGNSNMGAY